MTTRRSFLQAATAATLCTTAAASASASGTSRVRLHRVIEDARFPASIAFGAEARRLGHVVRTIDGDVTALWYEELHALWQRRPVAIAGLTAHGPLFCLERWAWDHGMRVVLRVDHQLRGDSLQHLVNADAPEFLQRRFTQSGAAFAVAAARAVSQCRAGNYQVEVGAEPACNADDPEPLITWVIAPVERT